MATVSTKKMTAEELLQLGQGHGRSDKRFELIKGELIEMPPTGGTHGVATARFAYLLMSHVRSLDLGEVFGAETGFVLARDPDTVRAPDAAFIVRARLVEGALTEKYLDIAPDLAVEVVSPNDNQRDVREKVKAWLDAGVQLVWVAYPGTRSVDVHQPGKRVRRLTSPDEELDGEGVLPGFRCKLSDVF